MTPEGSGWSRTLKNGWSSSAGALQDAATQRVVLALNHVLMSEPQACERLQPHAGSSIGVEWTGMPLGLPAPAPLQLEVTPAGLLEDAGGAREPSPGRRLNLGIDLGLALREVAAGRRPTRAVHLEGDSALATEVAWLMDNLRWDVEADLARFLPGGVAHELAAAARRAAHWLDQARAGLTGRGGR